MNRKSLMIFLSVSFFLTILSLIFIYFKNENSMSISLPYFMPKATPILSGPTPTPAQTDPYVQKGKDLINDLTSINTDLEKLNREDTRLFPPQFYLEKEVIQ